MRNRILLILLAVCVPAVMSAGGLTATLINTTASQDDYMLYFGCSSPCMAPSPGGISGAFALSPSVLPPGDYPIAVTIPDSISYGNAAAIGLVAGSSSDVEISLFLGVIAPMSENWSIIFPSTAESTIASELLSGDTTDLLSFFEANIGDFPAFYSGGQVAEYYEFSGSADASLIGHFYTVLSPEPGTLGLTGLLLGGLAFACRRRLTVDAPAADAPARTEK
jgi:hypothetical protein